jgi:multiple sugar transport system permease protein
VTQLARARQRSAYAFLAPYLLLFLVFFILPFVYSFLLSLQTTRGVVTEFVGLHNYALALADANFWSAVLRMVYFGLIQVTAMLLLALAFALVLDSPAVKGTNFFRLVYFLPYAVPGVVAAIMWGYLYSPTVGPIASVVHAVHGKFVNFLDPNVVLYSIMNMVTWEWTGYNMTILHSGLTSISPELYDAARIDGASEWQIALRIKTPLLRGLLVLTAVLSIIGTLQLFNEPYILASSGLTALPYSYTPNMDVYNEGFSFGAFNYSATLAVVLAVVTFVASYLFMWLVRRGQAEEAGA